MNILSNAKDQSIRVWDVRQSISPSLAVAPPESDWDYRHGEHYYSDHQMSIWKGRLAHKDDNSIAQYRGHSVFRTLIRARFSPPQTTGERYIYCGSSSPTYSVYIFDVLTGKIVKKLDGHKDTVRDVSWHPHLPEIVSSAWDGKFIKWSYSCDNITKAKTPVNNTPQPAAPKPKYYFE